MIHVINKLGVNDLIIALSKATFRSKTHLSSLFGSNNYLFEGGDSVDVTS